MKIIIKINNKKQLKDKVTIAKIVIFFLFQILCHKKKLEKMLKKVTSENINNIIQMLTQKKSNIQQEIKPDRSKMMMKIKIKKEF